MVQANLEDQICGFSGVSVVKNRPGVGQNLKNHVSTELFFKVNSDRNNTQYLNNITTRDFFSSRTGPLTSTGLSQLTGFIWTKYEKGSESPDVQIFHAGYMANCSATGSPSEKVGPGVRVFSVSPTVLHAKSSGEVRLRNVFPDSDPLIYGGILTEDADVQRLLAGIRFVATFTHFPGDVVRKWARSGEKNLAGISNANFQTPVTFASSDRFRNFKVPHHQDHS